MEGKTGTATVLKSIACGGTGGELTALDTKDGKIIRIRPHHLDDSYPEEELRKGLWEYDIDGHKWQADMKCAPNYFALAYKKRVYSRNRVKYPLKRVDWEPGGDPATMNSANRGRSKFKRISWDEAIDIMESEIRRIIEKYGPYSVICIGEDGHRESKDLHSGGGMHATLMSKLGGYTRETRTPDSVEGWYWGGKHVWGCGCNKGLGLIAPPQTGYNSWNVTLDVSRYSEMIVLGAGDLENSQNYASQHFSRLLKYWEELGKKFVSVDPWCTYTNVCHWGIKWIPIVPNTDVALDYAVIYTWLTEGTYDKDYVETHTVHFDKLYDYVMGKEDGQPKTPEWASPICGVPEWTIKAYARNTAKYVTTYAHYSSGSVKGPYSHENGRTEPYKLGLQGLGKPGVQQWYMNCADMHVQEIQSSTTRPFQMTNQCRMFYPSEQTLPRTAIAKALRDGEVKWWGSPTIVYVTTEEQFDEYNYPADPQKAFAMQKGMAAHFGLPEPTEPPRIDKIHMLWSEKPCNMNCWNGGFSYQDAIRTDEVEFYVTNHQWLENDSLFADLVLPVTTCIEDYDAVGASSVTSYKHAGIAPAACPHVGESMSDYEIAVEIAKRFGVEEQITKGMTEDEWFQFSFEQSRLPEEITWEEYKEKQFYIPKNKENWEELPAGMRLFYEDPEQYPLDTPTGKIEFWSQALADHFPDDKERTPIARWFIGGSKEDGWTHDETLWGERAKTYPLLIVANPARWRVHVQGNDIPWFREIETCKVRGKDGYQYEPVWMNPKTAEQQGIKNGDIVKVFNERGTILCGAIVSERVIPGTVLINKGSGVDPIAPHLDRGGAANLISPEAPVSKHCWGFVVTNYLVDARPVSDEEYEGWKAEYPDAFERPYDPAVGSVYDSWVIE